MSAKRVLVTGASGFVGRHSLPALRARGYDVHAVFRNGVPNGDAKWHRADLMVPADRANLLNEIRPTHLLHFAWYAVHGIYWTSTENLRWVEASLALLREFKEQGGQRAVLAGTCAEYDWKYGYCSEELTPTTATSLYGTSKNALRSVAASYAKLCGLSLAWGRIFFPFGPGDQPQRLVPSVIRALLAGETVRCSHGRQIRDFLYVGDVADAFAALLDSNVEGSVNVASGNPVAISDVVRQMVSMIPGATEKLVDFGAVETPPGDPPLIVADVGRLKTEVRWSPTTTLRCGLELTVAPYKDV